MLYDKRWDAQVKTADPFTIEAVVSWLEKQPARKRYVWNDEPDSCRGGCLIHQYLSSHNLRPTDHYQKIAALQTTGRYGFFDGDVAMERPFTFGAALNRALAAL